MMIQFKETLRRLCVEIGWSYSVFWTAIIRHNQMHLVWGDGHCARSTTGQSISGFEAMDLLLKERAGHRSSRDGLFGELGFQATDRVGSLVYKLMASEIHVVGDGIVGEAALTGKHQWILRDAVSNDGSVPKALTLMNHQFLAGIQTIAIIPVLPHGVLQLGSTEMVMENIEFINNVRSLFNELVSVPGALVSEVTQKPLSQNILQNSSLEVSTSLNQPGVPDTYISRFLSTSVDKSHCQLLQAPDSRSISQASCSSFSHLYGNMPPNPSNMSSTTSSMMPLTDFSQPTVHPVLEPIHSIGKSRTLPIEGQLRNNDNLFQTYDPESIQLEKHQSHRGLLHGAPQDGWQCSSSRVQESKRIISAVSQENHASAPSSQSIRGQVLNKKISHSPEQSTSGNDLFDLLDVHNKSWDFHGNLHDVFIQGNNANSQELCSDFSTCLTELGMGTVFDTLSEQVSCHGLFSEASPDQLLDAVVSCKTSLTNISSPSHHMSSATCGWAASLEQTHGECLGLPPLVKSEAAGSSSVVSSCGVERNVGCSQKDGGHKSQISLWVENSQNLDGGNSAPAPHGKGIDEVAKLNRKRSRSGENPRPRPKDRQMIQDRVKELRDIVPNGAKCSIDALLEKTIKHMLFLQSVTKHADKLKEVGEPKIVSEEGGLLLKDNFEGGATWAFEIGTQSMICPIIVEDLNLPRQMLVEMLCEERGLFLEIADLIRGLGLTILKGVLEARNDKVWARFAVEANRDVTRMEIFLSLVRLLEPNGGNSMVPLQGIESLNMPHNMFHSLPARAAGLSNCLLR